jgi:cytochrome P450 PksS
VNSTPTVVDLSDPKVRADPYPRYAELRRNTPVVEARVPFFGRVWLVTRYHDVAAMLKDARFSTDVRGPDRHMAGHPRWLPRVFTVMQNQMLVMDDPDHARLRNLVHQAFTPRRVEQMAARVTALVDELLDRAGQKDVVDLMADFALPLPLTVISDMMGVPEADRLRLHGYLGKFLETPSSLLGLLGQVPNGSRLLGYFQRLIRDRRAEPRDDLVSALVQAEQAGDRLNEDELLSMIFLLLLAGHETTVNLIGNGTLALMQHPDQLRRLHAEPGLIDRAVEELLRYGNPVEHGTNRFAREDVEVAGVTIPRGSRVLALLSSANRDETVFERADELDLGRHPNRHLAFGLGIHYCLGAPLARLEGQIAIGALVRRFPDMKLAVPADQVEWRNVMAVRGLKALPVRLGGR